MVEIFVDADACPVKAEVLRVAERHALTVHLVGNQWMRVQETQRVRRVVVPPEPDAADTWIAEAIAAADICLTADIPLAARCLERGAAVLDFKGKPFTPDSIGMALATRDLMAHLRETGEVSGGNRPFTRRDRSDFLQGLEGAVRRQLAAAARLG